MSELDQLRSKVTLLEAELERERKQNQMLSAQATYFFTLVQALDFHQGYLAELEKRMQMAWDVPDPTPERLWRAIEMSIEDIQTKRRAILTELDKAQKKVQDFIATISMPVIVKVDPDFDLNAVGVRGKIGPRTKEAAGGETPSRPKDDGPGGGSPAA